MLSIDDEYMFQMEKPQKYVKIFSSGEGRKKFVEVIKYFILLICSSLTINSIKEALLGKIFKNITRLRLFNGEGVEIFEEDIRFLKDKEVLYASARGEEFDSLGNFSEYKILKVLGEGGFGKVMLEGGYKDSEYLDVHMLKKKSVGNAEDIGGVFREAQLLQSLNHRNIVKIFKCYTLANMKVVFVMEYLEGGELLQYLEGIIHSFNQEKKSIEEEEAKFFVRQICEAINYCHSRKVIHRDLKLENVLLKSSTEKIVKVVDFGISGVQTFNTDSINAGSLMYMAPEVLQGKLKQIGPSIDIWAIGIMMYALLSGTLPFHGNTQQEVVDSILSGQPLYPDNISSLAKHLLSRIFQSDPNKRIKLMDMLTHPWLQVQLFESIPKTEQEQQILKDILKQTQTTIAQDQLLKAFGSAASHKQVTKNGLRQATKKFTIAREVTKTRFEKIVTDKIITKQQEEDSLTPVNNNQAYESRVSHEGLQSTVIVEEVPQGRRRAKMIQKRYSRILEIYTIQDKISKSKSPKQLRIYDNEYGLRIPFQKRESQRRQQWSISNDQYAYIYQPRSTSRKNLGIKQKSSNINSSRLDKQESNSKPFYSKISSSKQGSFKLERLFEKHKSEAKQSEFAKYADQTSDLQLHKRSPKNLSYSKDPRKEIRYRRFNHNETLPSLQQVF